MTDRDKAITDALMAVARAVGGPVKIGNKIFNVGVIPGMTSPTEAEAAELGEADPG